MRCRFLWARVKAEAERELMARFDAVCWRPGAIDGKAPEGLPWYYALARRPLFVLLSPFRALYIKNRDTGRAMLQATREGMRGRIVENREIRDLNPCVPGEFTLPSAYYVTTVTPRTVYRGSEEGTLPLVPGRWYLIPDTVTDRHPELIRDPAPVARAVRLSRT